MKKFTFCLIFVLLSGLALTAEPETIATKIATLKEKIKSHFDDKPELSWRQKMKIGAVLRKHRPEMRKHVDELRPLVVSIRKQFRTVLTHEQLLKIMDLEDEMILRPRGEKAAMLLAKMTANDRTELVTLTRKLFRGDAANIEQNLEMLHSFKMERVFPYIQDYLELSADQEQQIRNIIDTNHANIQRKAIKIITLAFEIREQVKEKLTLEQINYFESKRELIFEEVMKFTSEL